MKPTRLALLFAAIFLAALVLVFVGMPSKNSGGAPAIGGPFSLTDMNGAIKTDKDYRGKYMLVMFGYTYCPDICPSELQTIAEAMDKVGPLAGEIAPVFISIDPERDTPDTLRSYLGSFQVKFEGLTGTPEQIANVAKAYRVYYKKAKSATVSDYTVDHSTIIYLMDKQGHYLTHFSHETTPDQMAETLKRYLSGSQMG